MERTVEAIALRQFPLARDGITTTLIPAGPAIIGIPESLFPGLAAAGLVRPPTEEEIAAGRDAPADNAGAGDPDDAAAKAAFEADAVRRKTAVVEIPRDWESLGWEEKQALVEALTGERPKSKAHAAELVAAEQARRAAAAGAA